MPNDDRESETHPISGYSQLRPFLIAFAILTGLFYRPLWDLLLLSLDSELYSHLPLIPLVSAYLVWMGRSEHPPPSRPHPWLWVVPASLSAAILAATWRANAPHAWVSENYLAAAIFSYLLLTAAVALKLFGLPTLRANTFPIVFTICFVPLPVPVVDALEWFFQHTSAEVAHWLIKLLEVPVLREDWLVFRLPEITLKVATECSGIRSSLVLFIVSLIASYLFLTRYRYRVALILFIIPLAIFRNAVRVATIAALCYRVGPEMVDSWIHHQGGPLFFALSLGPFFVFLYILWRLDRKTPNSVKPSATAKKMAHFPE